MIVDLFVQTFTNFFRIIETIEAKIKKKLNYQKILDLERKAFENYQSSKFLLDISRFELHPPFEKKLAWIIYIMVLKALSLHRACSTSHIAFFSRTFDIFLKKI